MERPQNGVNGNMPQSNYGYIPAYVSASVPRGNAQNVFSGYDNMSQVISNQFLPPNYPNLQHNVGNQIRPISPQFLFPCTSNYGIMPGQYNHYQSYPQPYQFNYSQEMPPAPTKPINQPQVTRKFSPLVVVDPTSNTGLDLSRFHSNPDKSSVSSVLQISEPTNTNKLHSKSKLIEKEDLLKYSDSQLEGIEKSAENPETCILLSEPILKKENNTINDINENKITQIELNIDSEVEKEEIKINLDIDENALYVSVEIEKDSSVADLEEKESDNNEDIEDNECNITLHKDEFNTKNIEEDIHPLESDTSLSNYRLLINKKESDETTLKRKLIYDREYLIKFKDIGKSRQRPLKMPQTSEFSEDIISNTPRIISCQLPDTSSNQLNIEKNINKKQNSNRQYSSQGHKMYNRPQERKLIHLEISNNPVFIRTKSGYLPPQFRDKQKESNSQIELIRNIKSNLNKITPQNFQDCLTEISKLNIDNQDAMSCLINEIFIKAVKEEAYSVTYAQFCNKLSTMYSDNQSFKGQLLKKCQDMFETPLKEQLSTVRKDWELKILNETDLKMKALYESDLDEQVKKAKDKYFGNIRFIGELFLHNLLAAKVIINCIRELLTGHEESDAMLALCKLLETCGKQIDTKHKELMNQFIHQINTLSQSQELEKRIRFKLRDIVDMRDREWTLRHVQQEKQINPKTLQEQKEEAEAEATAAATKFAAMTKKKNFSNVSSSSSRRNVSTNPSNKLSITKLTCNSHTVDEKTVLGPCRTNWISGSGSKSKTCDSDGGWTAVVASQKQKNTTGRFTSNSRSREQSPQVSLTNKFRTLESSAEASGADSRSSTPPLPYQKAYRLKVKESDLVMSDEQRSDIIFTDLLTSGHFNIGSWMQLRQIKPVIEKWIDDMMEKDDNSRRVIGDTFHRLLIERKLSPEQLVDGTQAFVNSLDDLICDIPKLWEFFAQFLERFIQDKNSNISFFENIFKSILPSLDVALCFSMALHQASSRLGHDIVGQVFHRSIKWNLILSENLEHFIKTHNLEFSRHGGAPLSPHGGEPLNLIAEELDDMLSNNSSNENIFDFLEKHLDKPTWKKSECTRTITSSILKAIKKIPETSVREYLKTKMEIIKRISNHKTDHEFEILLSILHVAPDLKKETLVFIYDLIIRDGIVSSETLQRYLNDKSLQSERNYKLTLPIISELNIVNEKR